MKAFAEANGLEAVKCSAHGGAGRTGPNAPHCVRFHAAVRKKRPLRCLAVQLSVEIVKCNGGPPKRETHVGSDKMVNVALVAE